MPEKKLSTHFNLVIDQDRDNFLNVMMQLATMHPDFVRNINGKGLKPAMESFFKDMIEGTENTVWCPCQAYSNNGKCEHKV